MGRLKQKTLYIKDGLRNTEHLNIRGGDYLWSKIEAFDAVSGEPFFEPIHNRTVIAGAALSLQKMFSLNRSCLNNTPTYDSVLELDDAASDTDYPAVNILNNERTVIGSIPDETQRCIRGFCIGNGGSGTDPASPFHENYASWIAPDNLVPFRYVLQSADNIDENIYKGRKTITLSNNQIRSAYYFKEFSNTPELVQNYISTVQSYDDLITPNNVYASSKGADKAQSFVELHLKVSAADCREFFITHSGLEQAKINQISLVTAWTKTITRAKYDSSTGMNQNHTYEVYQQIRPFSLCNFPQIILDNDKVVSIIYTLYC